MVKSWPIEIDGLPNLKMVMFHGYGQFSIGFNGNLNHLWDLLWDYHIILVYVIYYYRSKNKMYPLVMTNSSPWYRWPIEIDGLPNLKMGDVPWLWSIFYRI